MHDNLKKVTGKREADLQLEASCMNDFLSLGSISKCLYPFIDCPANICLAKQ
jgi:hypothetical protein